MLKRFEMKDFIHFAYLAVIALVLAAVLAVLINTSIELINHGLNHTYQKTAFDYYVYLFGIAFIYLSICQPLIKPTHIIQEQPQDPEYLTLRDEISEMYLLAEMLDSRITGLQKDAMDHMNDYLHSFLIDDTLFEDLATQDTMAVLRHILAATYVNTPNKNLANVRLVNLMKELKRINNVPESNGV